MDSINHKEKFVSAGEKKITLGDKIISIKIHTNNVENLWKRLKYQSHSFCRIHRKYLKGVMMSVFVDEF